MPLGKIELQRESLGQIQSVNICGSENLLLPFERSFGLIQKLHLGCVKCHILAGMIGSQWPLQY